MARITFLSAAGDIPLVKRFTDQGVRSYPNVKRVTSHTYEDIDDIRTFAELIEYHAGLGHCLLKGHPEEPLVEESRKGKVPRDQMTDWLALDFDKISTPETFTTLERAADYLLSHLPDCFHNISYIVHASSSYGRDPHVLSMHMFFLLASPQHPRTLREYLTALNLKMPFYKERLQLSVTGSALSYPLDRAIADSSRLIYITDPVFEGKHVDPMLGQQRLVVVDRYKTKLDLNDEIGKLHTESITRANRRAIIELRKKRGLQNKQEKIKNIITNGVFVPVIINPDRTNLTFAEDCDDYIRYNVNGGDSNAYWVYKHDPTIVYNFKGESNFLFEKADPETYYWHISTFTKVDDKNPEWLAPRVLGEYATPEGLVPMAFLDYTTARYYYGYYDKNTERMESLHLCKTQDIQHFLGEHEIEVPDHLPVWNYMFEPHNPVLVNFEDRFINRYVPPDHVSNPVEIPDEYKNAYPGSGTDILKQLCPTVYKLLMSIAGNGLTEAEYFLNWLAYIVQTKEKTSTSWVFHGVPGTGKGLFFHHVLSPLIGEEYAAMKRTEDLQEKFNGWMQHTLLAAVDEFQLDGHSNRFGRDIVNKLKNLITEPKGTIRMMGREQQDSKLYINWIFFSNDDDAIPVQDGDRRFNICPRQETPLIQKYPELLEQSQLINMCRQEVPYFSAFLQHYQTDMMATIIPIENQAKQEMKEAARDAVDMFVDALINGNLDYFVPILDEKPKLVGEDYVLAAQNLMKAIIRDFTPNTEQILFVAEIRILYNVLCGKAENEHRFGKILARHGFKASLYRRGQIVKRGCKVIWVEGQNEVSVLQSIYLTDFDRKYSRDKEAEFAKTALH
jgi:hypothetical protein